MFPEYGTRDLYNRRLPHTYAGDVYYIRNSIRNSNIDKGLKLVFKPATQINGENPEDEATAVEDTSLINQSDVVETCLMLRDSVVDLKSPNLITKPPDTSIRPTVPSWKIRNQT